MELDTTKLSQAGQRKLTPHDNCTVLDLGTGSFPRLIELRLPGVDGARQSALWDGSLDLAINDLVIADEYAGQSIWRVSSMGGGDSGAGKLRVNKVWAEDFTSESLVTDASDNVTINTGTLTIPSDIIHLGDTDTKISFATDDVEIFTGNLSMLKLTEATQDVIRLGPGSGDVDINFNGDMWLSGATGNLGVGTAAPDTSSRLHVYEDLNSVARIRVENPNTGTSAWADVLVAASKSGGGVHGYAVQMWGHNATPTWDGIALGNYARFRSDSTVSGLILATGGAAPLIFGTSDNERVRILSGGDVGIGTNSPTAQLHVDQASTTAAQPVLLLDQADVSEEMRQFETTIGTGNAIEAAGLKLLTVTHYIKDTLPGGLTRYTPYGTISEDGPTLTKSATVTTQGLGANPDVFAFGYYEWATGRALLTQAAATQTFGTANISYASHAFAVTGGAGSVAGGGVVGLRVNGTSINDQGTRTVTDTETIIADITAVAVDEYYESPKKWLGQITFELFVVSGSPTSYSLSFNYGLAKYDDWFNNDFTITDIECVGFAGANDANFDIKLMHHQTSGWTYAIAGFTPITAANTIASLTDDHSTDDQLLSSQHVAWKRDNLSTAINGSGEEGFLVFVSSSANNAVEYLNLHIGVVF
jgi:hypothetical protein